MCKKGTLCHEGNVDVRYQVVGLCNVFQDSSSQKAFFFQVLGLEFHPKVGMKTKVVIVFLVFPIVK